LHELLNFLGIAPERLRLEWVSAAEGKKFSNLVAEFTSEVARLGPQIKIDNASREELTLASSKVEV